MWPKQGPDGQLSVKLGNQVSPRTVRKHLEMRSPSGGPRDQRWAKFVRNDAKAMVACDFLVSVTAKFQILYVFVALEIGSHRILHFNVTAHPNAEWTIVCASNGIHFETDGILAQGDRSILSKQAPSPARRNVHATTLRVLTLS